MNILIIFDSLYGHTEKVAHAMQEELSKDHEARMEHVLNIGLSDLAYVDLVIIGSPTHGGYETEDIKVFLDDGKDDEGQFYRACEKLDLILKQKGVDVQNHLFEGHHNKEYITAHLKTYLRFYGGDPETMIKTERFCAHQTHWRKMI